MTYWPNRLGLNLPRYRNWRPREKAELRASEHEREKAAPTVRVQSHFTKRTLRDFRCVWLRSNKTLRESDSHMETHHTDTWRCLATLPAPLFRDPAATPCARCATCPYTGAKTCANCCQSFHIPHLYSRDTHTNRKELLAENRATFSQYNRLCRMENMLKNRN